MLYLQGGFLLHVVIVIRPVIYLFLGSHSLVSREDPTYFVHRPLTKHLFSCGEPVECSRHATYPGQGLFHPCHTPSILLCSFLSFFHHLGSSINDPAAILTADKK